MIRKFKYLLSILDYNFMLSKAKNQTTRNYILKFIDMNSKSLTEWKGR